MRMATGLKTIIAAALVLGVMALGGAAFAADEHGGPQGDRQGDHQGDRHDSPWWENVPTPPEVLQKAMDDTARMRREFREKTQQYNEAVKNDNRRLADRLDRDLHRLRNRIDDRLRDVEDIGRKWREQLREEFREHRGEDRR